MGPRLPEHILKRRIRAFVELGCTLKDAEAYASTQSCVRKKVFKNPYHY